MSLEERGTRKPVDKIDLTKLLEIERDIIEREPKTKALRARSKSWLGRIANARKIKRIDEEISAAQQEVSQEFEATQQKVKETAEAKRARSSSLHVFFDTSIDSPKVFKLKKDQINALAQTNETRSYPRGIHFETQGLLKSVNDKSETREKTSLTLFDSTADTHQPQGLSVALTLYKLGFTGPNAVSQFNENMTCQEDGVVTTNATLSGPVTIGVEYWWDGVDTIVTVDVAPTIAYIDPCPADIGGPREGQPAKPQLRGRPLGFGAIDTDVGKVSQGRKRPHLPPAE